MSEKKMTTTQTGTLFYTKLNNGSGSFRVKFRSFHHANLENRQRQAQLEQIQSDYNFFKYGKSQSRKESLTLPLKPPQQKLYKNNRDRLKDGDDLKIRLKSMRDTRTSLFERIKSLKE